MNSFLVSVMPRRKKEMDFSMGDMDFDFMKQAKGNNGNIFGQSKGSENIFGESKNVGNDFLGLVGKSGGVDQGFGDFTGRRVGRTKRGGVKISNDPDEFGVGLGNFGSAISLSERDTATRRNKGIVRKRIKQAKERIKPSNPKSVGPTLARRLSNKIKARRLKSKLASKKFVSPQKTVQDQEATLKAPIKNTLKNGS